MQKFAIVGTLSGLTFAFISLSLHFGGKWIDKMLCVQPPQDPNKPIVRYRDSA
jgi:hypothetical protein